MADTLVGKTLGKYQVIQELGKGGMAVVYKAYQPSLDRHVAIKVLHKHLSEGQNFLERFQREARAAAALRHEHIVQVYDFDVQDDTYYMVMEYIEGQTLKDMLVPSSHSGKRLAPAEAARIFSQVASALAYAHKSGMLHRDIKPSNILMDQNGNAYLADFGIARIVSEKSITITGALIGTPEYMSPEQALGNPLSPASDIYSLGITLFELITSQVPFQANTPISTIQLQISQAPPTLRSLRADVPAALEPVLAKALAKNAPERYQTVDEFLNAVQTAIKSGGGAATVLETLPLQQATIVEPRLEPSKPPPAPYIQTPEVTQPPRKKGSAFWLVVVALGLIAVLLVAVFVSASAGWIELPFFPAGARASETALVVYVTSTQDEQQGVVTEELLPTETDEPAGNLAEISPTDTITLQESPTQAPTSTEPPLPTDTQIPTTTLEPPSLQMTRNVFCYQSPNQNSEQHWNLNNGDVAPILGFANNDWWLVAIDDPRTRTKCCWVNGGNPQGDLQIVPMINYEIDRMNCPTLP